VRTVLVLVSAAAGLAAPAAAQTNDEVFPQVQWNFSTPGARANGMGRTFIGQADDASAAVTNPAGLMNLTRPQVYAEYKNTDISVDRLEAPDSFRTRQPNTFTSNVNALSFVSFSMPLPMLNNKLAVGFSANQFLYYRETFHLRPRTLFDAASGNYRTFATNGLDGDVDLQAQSFGASVAYSVRKDLMVGATVSANRLKAKSIGTRFDFTAGPSFVRDPTGQFCVSGCLDLVPSEVIKNQTTIDDSAIAPGVAFGAIYRPSEMWQAGFTFTKSPKFTVNERFLGNVGGARTNLQAIPGFPDPAPLPINVPDRFGAGVAVHPTSRLLVAADVVRINYSSLAENFLITLDFPTATNPTGITPGQFSVDDGTELHVGGEFNLMTGNNPVFVRAGVFTNPDHTTRYTQSASVSDLLNRYYDSIYNLLPRETTVHGTFGVGIAIGPKVQIDAAYVHKKEFVASTAVRF
jgi:long-subunit fatty acid transport protein